MSNDPDWNPDDEWPDGDDDDDVPSADPAIRTNYEAAVGRLILAFNEVDYLITRVIEHAIDKLGGDEALHQLARGSFSQRVDSLALLQALHDPGLSQIDCVQLRDLNGKRNIVAHGHFAQNPFDGSYELIGQKGYKALRQLSEREYPAERLDEIAVLLGSVAGKLRFVELRYAYADILSEEPGAQPAG
jgi:hypothetical protein